jgi:hypothetical protein
MTTATYEQIVQAPAGTEFTIGDTTWRRGTTDALVHPNDTPIPIGTFRAHAESGRVEWDPEAMTEPTATDESAERLESLHEGILRALEDFEDEDDKNRIKNVLRQHDLSVPARTVTFRITVEGTEERDLDGSDDLEWFENLLEVRDVTAVSANIEWTHVFEFDDEYDGDMSDPCEDTDFVDDRVMQMVEDHGLSRSMVSFRSRSCDCC